MTRALAIAAILCLAACARSSQRTESMRDIAAAHLTPAPEKYKIYSVWAAFGANAVPMTAKQRAWILRIMRSRGYRSVSDQLYFVDAPGSNTPIIVFQRFPNGATSGIIGDWCQHYTPNVGASFGPSGPCTSPRSLDP